MATTFLFDLSGVLINWDTGALYDEIFDGDRCAVKQFFNTVLTPAHLAQMSRGRPIREVLDELKARYPDCGRALDAWTDDWDRMVTGSIDGTVAITRELRERGHQTYILGNWSREEFDRARARFAFLSEFHGAIISGDYGVMKPSAEIFTIATEKFKLIPSATLFVDDTMANVEASAALGFQALHFTDPETLRTRLSERGCLAVH